MANRATANKPKKTKTSGKRKRHSSRKGRVTKKARTHDSSDDSGSESSDGAKDSDSPFDRYKPVARWVARSQRLYVSWYQVLQAGLKLEAEDYDEEEEFLARFKVEIDIFKKLREIPQFADDMKKLKSSKFETRLVRTLRKASSGARADDASSLKSRGLDYVAHFLGPLNPPINAAAKKTHVRGFHHPDLARLIIGVDYMDSFDEDPEGFCQKLLIGKLKLEGGDFCVFLYDLELYDPNRLSSGLCRGTLLVLFWKHIFTGPSSALKTDADGTKAKAPQAMLNRMTCVTPESIAYAAVQLWWCICHSDDWRRITCGRDPRKFYQAILDAFDPTFPPDSDDSDDSEDEDKGSENREDPEVKRWVAETLSWWNKQVGFDLENPTEVSASTHTSSISILKAQRKSQRKLAQKTTAPPVAKQAPAQVQRPTPPRSSPAAAPRVEKPTAEDSSSSSSSSDSEPECSCPEDACTCECDCPEDDCTCE